MSQAELRKGRAEARIWQPMHSRLGIADDSLIFGRTVLAKVFVRGGLWEVDMPDDDGLAALLSAAYGKPIGVDDLILSKIK